MLIAFPEDLILTVKCLSSLIYFIFYYILVNDICCVFLELFNDTFTFAILMQWGVRLSIE